MKEVEQLIQDELKKAVNNPDAFTTGEVASLCSSLKDLQLTSLIQDIRDGRVKLGGISNIHGDNIVGPG